jgi:hypothetical protein
MVVRKLAKLPRLLAAFIHRGNGRSGGRAKMLNVGLHGRTSSAAALMAA